MLQEDQMQQLMQQSAAADAADERAGHPKNCDWVRANPKNVTWWLRHLTARVLPCANGGGIVVRGSLLCWYP